MTSILTTGTDSGAVWSATLPKRASANQRSDQGDAFAMKKNAWRAVIEVVFIIFLFYSNLLTGDFERSGMGQKRGVAWAIGDVFPRWQF